MCICICICVYVYVYMHIICSRESSLEREMHAFYISDWYDNVTYCLTSISNINICLT